MKTEMEEPFPQNTYAEAEPYHARLRPTYPKLVIVDDGESNQGEVIRLRSEKLTIGRQGCDLNFPAERLMSATHCSISLESDCGGQWRWTLRDNSSRHGLFLRLQEFSVSQRNEWLAGGTRFTIAGSKLTAPAISESYYSRYVNTEINQSESLVVAGYNHDFSASIKLQKKMQLGAVASSTSIAIPDTQIEPTHFDLRYIDHSCWSVIDNNSHNGTWLRINHLVITSNCSFIAGEQRFILNLES